MTPSKAIIHYHEQTKHHYHRYAKSLGYMDWKNQPNPFRFYQNTATLQLPLLKEDPQGRYQDLYVRSGNASQNFNIANIAGFLELSLGLSAWKAMAGSQWSLRINPSSGNLHPTEAHLILPQCDPIESGVYHYNVLKHALEKRAVVPDQIWHTIRSYFKTDGFLIGLSSIFWRESWKYGERAFRYCNHDVGHALAALSFSANLFGWKVAYLNGLGDDELTKILGFDQTTYEKSEEEHPDLLCFIYPHSQNDIPASLPETIVTALSRLRFGGSPNALSEASLNWEIICQAAQMTRKPSTPPQKYDYGGRQWIQADVSPYSAVKIIRKRRSATAFDRKGSVSKKQFLAILDKTIARNNVAPFDVQLMPPSTHLLLFVHHVEQLTPGLYFFVRHEEDFDEIKNISRSEFLWKPTEEGFPLFLLQTGNFRQDAIMVSCHQDIAGDSSFSLGMISKFREIIGNEPFRYRHLFWETGMIGQVLYLAAEAHGVRATGIGCFFDDPVQAIMGFEENTYQSLYHFTIGKPVEDPRLTTYPPYGHLKGR